MCRSSSRSGRPKHHRATVDSAQRPANVRVCVGRQPISGTSRSGSSARSTMSPTSNGNGARCYLVRDTLQAQLGRTGAAGPATDVVGRGSCSVSTPSPMRSCWPPQSLAARRRRHPAPSTATSRWPGCGGPTDGWRNGRCAGSAGGGRLAGHRRGAGPLGPAPQGARYETVATYPVEGKEVTPIGGTDPIDGVRLS